MTEQALQAGFYEEPPESDTPLPPGLSAVPDLEPESKPIRSHYAEHGLCYRTDCVKKYGMPLIMRNTVYFTPHQP